MNTDNVQNFKKLTPEQMKQRNLETYGVKIKTFRKAAGITVDQLADILGISKSSVRNWECGLTRPDPDFLYQMFHIFDVEPNEFFGVKGVGELLTNQERELVDLYRTLDEPWRDALLTFVEAMSQKTQHKRTETKSSQ